MFGENALLLEVRAPGATDDYGDPDVLGDLLWSGRVPATLRRARALVGYEAQGAFRTGGGGRTDEITLLDKDELIVRSETGLYLALIVGGTTTQNTVTVNDLRDPLNPITEQIYGVIGAELRAGATPGQSISIMLESLPS